MHVELLLQLLVGIVDTELLEGVDLKSLKAVDVQHPNELVHLEIGLQCLVDVEDNPVKQVGVNALHKSVSGLECLRGVHGLGVGLPHCDDLPAAEPGPQLVLLHLQQLTDDWQAWVLRLHQARLQRQRFRMRSER